MQEELPPGAINIQYIRPTRLSRSRPHSFSNGKRYHHVCWRWGGVGWGGLSCLAAAAAAANTRGMTTTMTNLVR